VSPSFALRASEGEPSFALRSTAGRALAVRAVLLPLLLLAGSLQSARADSLQYTSPYQQTIVSDGTRLYVYDQDLNQVTVKKLKGAIPASPASILFGSNDFERDFQVKSDGEHDGIEWILATPRSKDSSFDRIRIGFRDGLPAAMDLTDSFGQTTQLRFAGVQRNAKIDPARFHFDPPKGADVLEDQ
jgi:outer membrane lipoprotein carrier protein